MPEHLRYSVKSGSASSRRNTRLAIRARRPFATSGALFAADHPITVGNLDGPAFQAFQAQRALQGYWDDLSPIEFREFS